MTDLAEFRFEHFAAITPSRLRVETTAGEVCLELVAVNAGLTPPAGSGFRQPFSLRFTGPRAPQLLQGTYRVFHESFRSLELFLVPIGATADSVSYEAVFG